MNPLKDRPLRFLAALFLAALACSFARPSFAQVYPIHVTTQLQGPYTPYLSDYTTPGSQKLLIQLRVNDPTLAEYRCKLRVTIEGVGITLRTKQSFIPDPIVLSGGGIPEIFYGADLASYFDPANLDFAGFSRSEFNQSARLPEGIYRFTIEVLDYNKNIVVSNAGTAMAWIILNDPPILNLPRNETKLQLIDPTNIVFTWTPRHRGSPNAALTTEYIFRLVEIWPASRNPYDAFLSQPTLYETTTDMQQLLYGPAEPALIPGRRYAWQVQAVDIEKRDLFKNQGRSEVFVFQYGDELTAPENLRLQSANPSNLTVRWDQVTGGTAATNFRVQYREHRNRSSNEWYETQTTDQWRAIPQLKSDTEYEVQVRAEQQFQVSPYTVVQVFRTLTPGANEFVCRDDAPPPPLPSSTTPLFELAINDTIKAGGYNVLVRSVTGGSGTYSGEGMAIIPYLNGAKVRVTFENIRVNGQNMLTAGVIKSYWNPDSKFLLDVETETRPEQMSSAGEIPVTIVATETLIEITGAAIATVSKDEDDNIVVHTTDGKQQTLEKGETYSVVDEQGNGYVIDDQGNIAKTSAAEARAAHDRGNRTYNLALTFAKGDGKLGFDDLPLRAPGQYSVLHPHYQQVDGTFIPWKAVTSSPQDAVTVIPDNAEMDLNGVRFEVNGVAVQPQNNSGNIKLNLYGKTGGMVEELIATTGDDEQSEVLGKLNLVSYDGLTKNVVIVPVNNASLPGSLSGSEISNRLTEIFQQAVAKVQVSIAPNLNVTLDDTFDDGESGMLSNYTGDMKKVINAFGNIQDDTYYLFLVNNPEDGPSSLGFMPRSKQVGFIFADNLASDAHAVRTMAHELSHGMFNLKHTFSEFTTLSRGTTENLMDYSVSGTELLKYQWDYVHNPQRVVPLFEGDEEAEMMGEPSKDEIVVEYTSVTENFTPGVNRLVIQFKLPKLDSIMAVHADKVFRASLQIHDNAGGYVFARDLPLDETGTIEWDGFLEDESEERIWFENGPYVIQIKIMGGLESNWDRFLACMGSPVDCLSGELQTTITGYGERTFTIDEDREKWEKLTFKSVDPQASFSDYLSQKNMFITDLGLNENENPLEYLNNNLIEFEFLGETMVLHKRFAYALKIVKENFSSTEYAALSSSMEISNGFRAHKTTNSGVSRHQFGMAFDINPSSNPMIISDSQAEIFHYIKIITGLDMYNKSVSLDQTIAAQNLFESRILDNQINAEQVRNALVAAHTYENTNEKLSLLELSQNVIENTLMEVTNDLRNILHADPPNETQVATMSNASLVDVNILEGKVRDAIAVLNDYKTALAVHYTNTDDFQAAQNYLDRKAEEIEDLKTELTADPINVTRLRTVLGAITTLQNIESFSTLNTRIALVKSWVGPLNDFGKNLMQKVNSAASYRGGNLFKNGFFNLPTVFSKMMENNIFIRWGGGPGYRSLKDWMHFEIDPAKMRDLLALDESEIDNKLNE